MTDLRIIFLMSLACLDSPSPGTLKRQIIEKEDIFFTGIACYSLSQLKLLSMALELMLSLSFCYLACKYTFY